jgi:hypothetical protein
MSQHYSDPARESDPHALPDVEVFYRTRAECNEIDREALAGADPRVVEGGGICGAQPGWYWWSCFPGCLPDGDPSGPFATEAEALADARGGA